MLVCLSKGAVIYAQAGLTTLLEVQHQQIVEQRRLLRAMRIWWWWADLHGSDGIQTHLHDSNGRR